MLTKEILNQILDSKEELTNFVTAAFVQAIAIAVDKLRDPATSASAAAALIEALRKARADLTGDSAEVNMPQMLVNIQFSDESRPKPVMLSAERVNRNEI